MNKRIGLLIGVMLTGAGLAFWFFTLEPILEHQRWERRVHAGLKSLRNKKPVGVSPNEWEHVVDWTFNLHGNCGIVNDWITTTRWEKWQFLEEFEGRLNGQVGLSTVDWFWDEYARITKGGQSYSDRFRPTRDLPLQYFEWPG